ncbi:MAG: class IV adenylate cyclase [Acidobacteriota bacterium]|jgi:adenylate cyclase class 2|nr:class IV adenylate cyclase [Acidobacteriota bacterium]
MATETEVKIRLGGGIAGVEAFCQRLLSAGAECVSERSFEDNVLVDFPDGRLRAAKCALRVRSAGGKGLLTYKGAPVEDSLFKSREELETEVGDPAAALEIVRRIGMAPGFRYQKYRREFALDGTHVAVDETPVGDYAEIEGAQEGILRVARKLGVDASAFIRQSYHALHAAHCRERGVPAGDMVFQKPELEAEPKTEN